LLFLSRLLIRFSFLLKAVHGDGIIFLIL